MTGQEALKIIGRQAPCPHDNTDTSIGDGSTWARCYDCGVTFEQANAQRAIDAATEFERAIEKLRHLIL